MSLDQARGRDFLVLTKRSAASGDENATSVIWVLNLRMADVSQNAVRLRDRCQYPLVCYEATFPGREQNGVEGVVYRPVQKVC